MLSSLHITGSRQMGGADQFFVRLVQALRETEHQVSAVTRRGAPIAKSLSTTPVEQIHLPLANSWDFYSAWRIRRLVRAKQPQIVQTYMGRATRLTRLSKATGVVHIARLGGYYKLDGYYRHAHAWIGNTKGICDYLIREGLPAGRVFHIGNFAPEPLFYDSDALLALRDRLGLVPDAWVIFALGRFIPKKGFDDLLRAFAQAPAKLRQRRVHLLVAGDGPLYTELQALAGELGVNERVRWLGWQDAPGAYFALADMVVCPSRHEPLGNVILEAWSYGKPVLSTATEGPTELIEDNENGLLVPPCDSKAMAMRIEQTLSQGSDRLEQLGKAGERTLKQRFSKAAIVRQYLDLYAQLSDRQRGER